MPYVCRNPACKRKGKAFDNGSAEDSFFSYLQHASSTNACWEYVNQSDRDWWIEHGYSAPAPVGRPSKVKLSTTQVPVMQVDETFPVNITMTVNVTAGDTVDTLRSQLYHMIDRLDKIDISCNNGEVHGHEKLSEVFMNQKKKQLWMEWQMKSRDRPQSPVRRRSRSPRDGRGSGPGLFGSKSSGSGSGIFGK